MTGLPSEVDVNIASSGKSYEIIFDKKTLSEAVAAAEAEGGALAQFETQTEWTDFWNNVKTDVIDNVAYFDSIASDGGGVNYVWLGANDISSEGVWVWNQDFGE